MVIDWLKKQGYHPASPLNEMQTWLSWYKGQVKDFHSYQVWTGQRLVKRKRTTMNMGKQICQDWASLILNEQVAIDAENEGFNEALHEVLESNHFHARANALVELMMAYGTAAFAVHTDGDAVVINYYRGDMIFPLAWDGDDVTDCAFASLQTIDGKECYAVTIHERASAETYQVRNALLDKESGKPLPLPDSVVDEYTLQSPQPRFQIIRPNLVNNVDFDSPFGISVLANAIGRLEKVDLIFDSGSNEFSLGKKRIIIPLSMTKQAVADGLTRPVFDPNDVAYYGIDLGDEQKPFDLTGQLRIAEHSQGLQDALNYLSDGVGLGTDRYEYSQAGAIKTATEVISEKSELYQNLRKHELILDQAIRGLCASIAEILGYSRDEPISVSFDDSIITDRDADIKQAIQLTSSGLKSKLTAMMDLYGWTEEQAREELQRIEDETASEGIDLSFG